MANFSMHINTAAIVSGISAMSLVYTGAVEKPEAFVLFFAGIIGGVLPDIDHDKSTPVKIMQFFFANLMAFLVTYKYVGKEPLLHLVMIWLLTYVAVAGIFYVYKKFTRHRGIFHSVPMAFVFWFLTTLASSQFFHIGLKLSYFIGFFVFLGYMVHLILDEIYSVDVTGAFIKRSFGSALKFTSGSKIATLSCYVLLIALFIALPHKTYLLNIFERFFNV